MPWTRKELDVTEHARAYVLCLVFIHPALLLVGHFNLSLIVRSPRDCLLWKNDRVRALPDVPIHRPWKQTLQQEKAKAVKKHLLSPAVVLLRLLLSCTRTTLTRRKECLKRPISLYSKYSQVNWGLRGNRLVTSTRSKSHFLPSTFLLFLLHCLLFSLCGCNFSNFSVDTDYFLFHSWFIVACLCILLFSFMLLFFLISLKIYTSHSYLFKNNNAEYSSSRWGFFYYAISMSFSPWVSSLSRTPAWELWDHGWGVWARRLSLRVTGQEQPTDRVYFQRHKQRRLCTRMANTWLSLDNPSVSLDKNLIIFTRI